MPDPNVRMRRGYHVMTKPTGSLCNLNCAYCFYLEKEKLYGETSKWAMSPEVLETYVRQYIESQDVPELNFAWQGGEPTILGVDFFRTAVELQCKYANGKRITNAFQTNGILLNDEWGRFLSENQFLVGISVDGPRELHDYYRRDRGGGPSFDKVMKGVDVLCRHKVEFNALVTVQRHNSYRPLEVYRFLRGLGTAFSQFIPIVERIAHDPTSEGLTRIGPDFDASAEVAEWSVEPLQFGKFLVAIFDEWVRNDVGRHYVQVFDSALEAWVGMEPSLCIFSRMCGNAAVLEHNGDLYSCDHYVYPENKLGNIMETNIKTMMTSTQQRLFGNAKLDALPQYCRKCDFRFMCNGECPKHRFAKTPDGEGGLSYLCEGYKHLFAHIDPYMRFMANEVRQERPAANVMGHIRMQDLREAGKSQPGPNEPCMCGSGRKYKKCCGRQT